MSSSEIAIEVRGVGKKYRIGASNEKYYTLRDQLSKLLSAPFRLFGKRENSTPNYEEFWALKDINFQVKKGEVVGIIGRNGAGKSTLLKILSRITEPTEGEIDIHGRVGSLLEVGTGFHPELTGRENIYLNGAILGMKRAEINRKFDEIVAFAEVEKFIDTPVKYYSSGMYMRLAFAVAAHLEPEILIVDEVLAVGDAQFQQKCLSKMSEVAAHGRTVLFVSHNMDSIIRLCSSGILLREGLISNHGIIGSVVKCYALSGTVSESCIHTNDTPRSQSLRNAAKIIRIESRSAETLDWIFAYGSNIRVQISFIVYKRLDFAEIGIGLFSSNGTEIVSCLSSHSEVLSPRNPAEYECKIDFDGLKLIPGRYLFSIGIRSEHGMEDYLPSVVQFEIESNALSSREYADTFGGWIVPFTRCQIRATNQHD